MPENANNPQKPFEDIGKKLDERFGSALSSAEEELRRVIKYLNDEIVPQVRQNSAQALKAASEQLNRLAQYLDKNKGAR